MDSDRLRQLRDGLPPRLNVGILLGDGGFCILGWMLFAAGFHEIGLYNNTVFVAHPDPDQGGPAVDVVARTYGLSRDAVVALARVNDGAPLADRVAAVRAEIDRLLDAGSEGLE